MRNIKYADTTRKEDRKEIAKYYRSIGKKNKKRQFKKKNKKQKVRNKPINYKNGLSYDEFLKSEYWSKIRFKVKNRDGFHCTVCESRDNLQVHHTTYKHLGLEYKHLEDLLTLCANCHRIAHGII